MANWRYLNNMPHSVDLGSLYHVKSCKISRKALLAHRRADSPLLARPARDVVGKAWYDLQLRAHIFQQRARLLQVFGLESFREAVVDESKLMKCLIPLSAFGE